MGIYTRKEVQDILGIGKTQFYEYRKTLGIQSVTENGKSGITEADLQRMLDRKQEIHPDDDLPQTIITTEQPAEPTPEPIAEQPAEPIAEPVAPMSAGNLATVSEHPEKNTDLSVLNLNNLNLNDPSDIATLVNIAKRRKVQQILQPELVMAHLMEQLTEEDLDEELRQEIEQTRRKINAPLENPAAIASLILSQYRGGN